MFSAPKPRHQRPVVEALEPKLLYSADLGLTAFAPASEHGPPQQQALQLDQTLSVSSAHAQVDENASTPTEIVFIDAAVPDADTLVQDIEQQAAQGRHIEAILIQAGEDGLSRITQTLQARHDVQAVHVIGHGESGDMQLGTAQLDAPSLLRRAGELASWGTALTDDGDLLLYGCDVASGQAGQALVHNLAALTGADVAASDDTTGASILGGNWVLEARTGQIDASVAISAASQAQWLQTLASSTPGTTGIGIFSDASSGAPKLVDWDGFAVSAPTAAPLTTNWTVMASAQAPDRGESIVMGIDANGVITAYMQRNGVWSSLGQLATGQNTNRMCFQVQYEQQSGQALMVWDNGTNLSYNVWNGSTWAGTRTYSTASPPDHMQLAASPSSDHMVLIYSGTNVSNYAVIWKNGAWSNPVTLDTGGSGIYAGMANGIDIAAAYESQSGTAMVAYAKKNNANVYYRLFENNAWTAEATFTSPVTSGETKYLTLAGDPRSDRIVMTQENQTFTLPYPGTMLNALAVWDGSAWGSKLGMPAVTAPLGIPSSAVFESQSGEALAVYYDGTAKAVYRTWSPSTGWSAALAGAPALSATPLHMDLFADPHSNTIMLGAIDSNKGAYLVPWLGSSWGPVKQITTNSGVTQSQAYTWLWDDLPASPTYSLWLGASLDNSTGWSGVNAIYDTEALALNDTGLSLGAGSTSGSFSHVVDLSAFGMGNLMDVAWVSRTVALSPSLSVNRGDILFTANATTTLTSANTLGAVANDLILFRPTVAGDYSAGTFTRLANINATTGALRGLALVEKDTILGDVTLSAGTLLFTQGSATSATTIYQYNVATSTASTLINGASLGLNVSIAGLELISAPSPLANVTLAQGSLLVSLQQAGTVAGLSMTAADVARLAPTRTSVNGTAAGSATLLVQGASLGITSNSIDTLALLRPATDNSTPTITSNGAGSTASINVAENSSAVTTVAAFDPDAADTLTYSVSGTDAARFTINSSTGVLSFSAAPNYEAPLDAGANNIYNITVQVSDGSYTDTQDLAVNITPVNDNTPAITSSASASIAENTVAVITVAASDADTGTATTLSYSITGGADAALFQINASTGALTFTLAPNFEAPQDADANNQYQLTVQASDGTFASTRAMTVTVLNANERPTITSDGGDVNAVVSVTEGGTSATTVQASDPDAADTLTYSVSGTDASLFNIDSGTGVLTFKNGTSHAAPQDSNGDNIYVVDLTATDAGGLSSTQHAAIRVLQSTAPANTAPVIISDGGGITASLLRTEEQSAVTTVQATDAENDALTYSIAGGADQALFDIDPITGALRFRSAPSAVPADDADHDNIYEVRVNVSDGALNNAQDLRITLQAYNRPPVNTLPVSFDVSEDNTLALTGLSVADTDAGGATITVTLSVQRGTLSVLDNVASGLTAGQVTLSADARQVVLSGTVSEINATLAANGAVNYTPDANYNGSDTLSMLSDDLGQSGVARAPAQTTDSDNALITIAPVNDPPIFTGSGASVTYVEHAAAIVVDDGLSLSDGDTGTFTGATIDVSGASVAGEDELLFADQLGITHTWRGSDSTLLLSGNASASDYQAALRSITYRDTLTTPDTAPRTVTFHISDGSTTVSVSRGITIATINNAPTLAATAGTHAFTEALGLGTQADAVNVFDNTAIGTVESGQGIAGLGFTLSGLVDGADEVIVVDGTRITLGGNSAGTTLTHGLAYTVSVLNGSASVDVVGGISTADAQTLIDGLAYQNTNADNPTSGNRLWTLTRIQDDGGTANGSTDTTALAITSTVAVTKVNDPPTLTTQTADLTFTEAPGPGTQASALPLFSGTVISTIETGQNITGLTLVLGGLLDGADEVIVIDGQAITLGSSRAGVSAAHGLTYMVIVDGTFASVSLSGQLSVAQAQTLVDAIAYQSTRADEPTEGVREVQIAQIQDDGGSIATALTATSTVAVVSANDAPTLSATATDPRFTEAPGLGTQAAAVQLFSGALVSTVESGQSVISLSLNISGLFDGGDEVIAVDGQAIALGGNSAGTTATNSLSYTVAVSGDTASISLTGSLSSTAAQTLIDTIAYQNTNTDMPTAGNRVVRITQIQDDGGTAHGGVDASTLALSSTVAVVPVNDAPALSATAGNPSFIEASGLGTLANAVSVFSGALLDTVDPGQALAGLNVSVSGLVDGSSEVIVIDGQAITLGGNSTGTTLTHGLSYTVTLASGTASIALTGSLPASDAQTLIDAIAYQNTNTDTPTAGNRVVSITQIQDNGGTADSGVDVSVLTLTSTVTINGVNDAPTLSATALDPGFTEASGVGTQANAVQLFQGALASTMDTGQAIAGLTLSVSGLLDASDEAIVIDGLAITLGGNSAGTTAANGLAYTVTLSGDTASISLVGGLSTLNAQTLVNALAYQNTRTDTPTAGIRAVRITGIQDDGGTALGGLDASMLALTSAVTVTPVDDAPTVSATPLSPAFTEAVGLGAQAAAVQLFNGALVNTVEPGQAITGFTLSLGGLLDGSHEVIVVDGQAIALGGNQVGTSAAHGLAYSVGIAGSVATITFTGSLSTTQAQTLIDAITYQNTAADNPTAGHRVLSLTQMQDSGGSASGALSLASTVSVSGVNDGPDLTHNTLEVNADGSTTLTIRVADPDTAASDLILTGSNISGGYFVNDRTNTVVTDFDYSDVLAGHIRFVENGGATAPSYVLRVSDGQTSSNASGAEVTFKLVPISSPSSSSSASGSDGGNGASSSAPVNAPRPDAQPGATSNTSSAVSLHDIPTVQSAGPLLLPDSPSYDVPDDTRGNAAGGKYRTAPSNALTSGEAQARTRIAPSSSDEDALSFLHEAFQLNWRLDLRVSDIAAELRRDLDTLRSQLQVQTTEHRQVVASTIALTTGLSVGYVIWLVRGGVLLGSMLSAMPAWQMIDPLPVLTRSRLQTKGTAGHADDDADAQPVEQMFDDQPGSPPKATADQPPPMPSAHNANTPTHTRI